jgi:hypothetical protein
MSDFAQEVFDAAEEVAQQLDYAAGCDDALFQLLDGALSGAPIPVQRAVFAVFEAQRNFRNTAARQVLGLTRQASLH